VGNWQLQDAAASFSPSNTESSTKGLVEHLLTNAQNNAKIEEMQLASEFFLSAVLVNPSGPGMEAVVRQWMAMHHAPEDRAALTAMLARAGREQTDVFGDAAAKVQGLCAADAAPQANDDAFM
jgi:hypothetical protein